MAKQCLKCGYERQASDRAPDYECPKCGAVYAKVEAAQKNDILDGASNPQSSIATKAPPYSVSQAVTSVRVWLNNLFPAPRKPRANSKELSRFTPKDDRDMTESECFDTALQWATEKATSSDDVMQELAKIAKRHLAKGTPIKINKGNTTKKILNATWTWPGLDDCEERLSIDRANGAEVAELFVHMVIMKAYALRRCEGHMRNISFQPWGLFDAVGDSRTPEDCHQLDGTIRRLDDPFWISNPIPCGRPLCRCRVIALSERQARARMK